MSINQGLRPLTNARSNGFSDVLYLDSATRKYVEEVSSCNIFVVKVILLAKQIQARFQFRAKLSILLTV